MWCLNPFVRAERGGRGRCGTNHPARGANHRRFDRRDAGVRTGVSDAHAQSRKIPFAQAHLVVLSGRWAAQVDDATSEDVREAAGSGLIALAGLALVAVVMRRGGPDRSTRRRPDGERSIHPNGMMNA